MCAKCFLSAIHSSEEQVHDRATLYFVERTVVSLYKNWRSFLDLANKTMSGYKDDLTLGRKKTKELLAELEAEKQNFETKLEKEKIKHETKPLVQELRRVKEKYTQQKIATLKERKELANQIALLTANNAKLAESLQNLREETDIVRMTGTIQQLRNELHQAQEMLKREKEERSNTGFKLYTLLDAAKKEGKEKDSVIADLNGKLREMTTRYNATAKELTDYKALVKENGEIMQMTREDILRTKLSMAQKQSEIVRRDERIRECTAKIGELESQIKLEREGLIQKKEVSMEGTLFYFVADNPLARKNDTSKASAREGRVGEFGELKEIDTKVVERAAGTGEVKLESINFKKYMYLRPTYRTLIDALLPQNETAKVSYTPAFPVWLQITIRAIFDAKLNELLFVYNKGKQLSRFPEFVYSWLGTFCVDKESRNARLLEYTEKDTVTPESRRNLLLALEAAGAAKLWEIAIFKDFLEETLSLDELAFFLHCRFIMFKGPQLAIPAAGFCVTHFVTKERVYDTIDRVLYKHRSEERKELKRKLVDFNKQTYRDPNVFDYAMVLRILLELYRKEKKESFVRLEELFAVVRKNSQQPKTSMPFEPFYRVFSGDYDKAITDLEVAHLYRESFISGAANVNIDSTLLTMCET